MTYSAEEERVLLDIARRSIEYGLRSGRPLTVDVGASSPALCAQRASFVTLQKQGALRGCIGTLEAYRPLITDVAEHAFAAAFRDPRFAPVSSEELPLLDIHISILTPPQEMNCSSQDDLLAQLRPGIDGLILAWKGHRGTFLPSVWEILPHKQQFLDQLKIKAGLPAHFWHDDIGIQRYQAVSIPSAGKATL
jgi:AmmeMemoRadiSam system protein A